MSYLVKRVWRARPTLDFVSINKKLWKTILEPKIIGVFNKNFSATYYEFSPTVFPQRLNVASLNDCLF